MQTKRIVPSLVLSIGCGIAIQNPAFAEEYRGTLEQRMACTPDVWRLCSDQMPDVNGIVACLRQNKPQLSSGCRAVFEKSATAQRRRLRHAQHSPKPYSRKPCRVLVPRSPYSRSRSSPSLMMMTTNRPALLAGWGARRHRPIPPMSVRPTAQA